MARQFIEGNEAVALGAMAAGCRFFAGYPITPATSIFSSMLRWLPPAGGVCLQGEDEIASLGFCLGASMAGLKSMTATSGPGISLMSEQISFAIAGEIPVVIVDVQRLGPATGSATRGADGDIQFLRWGSSGGLPPIVLAPVDAADCYRLTAQAFNLAERFRSPVVLASNKEVGMTREIVDLEAVPLPQPERRRWAPEHEAFAPFAPDQDGVPAFLPMGGERLVRQTSSSHGPEGYITADPGQLARGVERLQDKLRVPDPRLELHQWFGSRQAATLVIAYGVTVRAARAALRRAPDAGGPAGLLALHSLWPVPERLIRRAAAGCRRVLVVEMNLGQYVRELRRLLPDKRVDFLGQMDGRCITPTRIAEALADG